ncbi:hypothetical protein OPT61_g6061 [Boeremia exigua]|uniref:Uncharacterized protein n=1 Tax=Boeremia exigua TaxID=749465 RepID=A0ACC2I821_9PLEO|nr:hypothetical protein OPT61_g6061 [Boeremia exigua]
MRSTLALSLAAFAGFAAAQSTVQNDYPYRIDPESVSSANRRITWLSAPSSAPSSPMSPPQLLWRTIATLNGATSVSPAATATAPAPTKCRSDHPCGAQSPPKNNNTMTSSMSTASATGTDAAATSRPPTTGFGGAATTSAAGSSTGAAAATFVPGAATSMAVLFGSVFFGFAVLL